MAINIPRNWFIFNIKPVMFTPNHRNIAFIIVRTMPAPQPFGTMEPA